MKITYKNAAEEKTIEAIYLIVENDNGDSFIIRGGKKINIIKDAPSNIKVIPSSANCINIE